ncbi:MAG: tetratricopeptide repeat protein [Sphingomonadaceae bacterium]|nr:tetratricopeptide repeat protein [Sphingomonadaceae bacterium]
MSRRRRRKTAARAPQVPLKVAAFAGGGLLLMLALILLVARSGDSAGAFARAEAYAEAGDMASARVEAMNAVQAEPDNEAAWLLLARSQLALGDGPGAAGTVARARAAGVTAGRTRHLFAEAALLQGDTALALSETAADDIAPEFLGDAARMRARALHTQGDTQRAAAVFDVAIEIDPESSGLWLDIARFRMDTGALGGAIEAADRSVELDATNVEALVLKGRLVRSQYGLVASLPWFERALEVNPDYMPALFEQAKTLGEVGRYTEMLAATRAVLKREPGNADALYLQAVLAARAQFPAGAKDRRTGRWPARSDGGNAVASGGDRLSGTQL